jgi:S1-C subfamily serine protease
MDSNTFPHFSRPLSVLMSLIFLTLYLSACAIVTGQMEASRVAEQAQREIREGKRLLPEGSFCGSGLLAFPSGVIHTVLPYTAAAGLKPGDRIVAVNGTRGLNQEGRTHAIVSNPPGTRIVVTVDRQGSETEIAFVCEDGARYRDATMRILEAASRKDWMACKEAVQDYERIDGIRPAAILQAFLSCSEAQRLAQLRRPNFNDAGLVYEANRKGIEEARYDLGVLASIRGEMLSKVEWLRANGFQSFAQDLRAELDKPPTRQAEASPLPPTRQTKSQGTCFAVTPDGGVLTAYHIVKDANEIWVTFATSQREKAAVEQSAMTVDIALLRINRKVESYLPLASTRSATAGQHVFTIGFPATQVLGFEPKFTDGSISALSGVRGEASFMQITVPIQPGNSGGPLMNDRGEVLGIITSTAAIAPFFASTGSLPQNVNWAIKADYAIPLMASQNIQLAPTREEAIKRGMSAVCLMEANQR